VEEQGGDGYPGDLASQRVRGKSQLTGPGVRPLGRESLESGVLVPRDVTLGAVAQRVPL